ncbi:MAG: TauD/TfdA family dioxygenase [Rhodospirillaceae bacterium]|nr:TauD/TfdA family dioxygenase [Rhodospirillaceae bacterium]MDD9928424.1 TauD/TfdA family dioxygenase [Rhodospirillaceae bacterium]
MGLNIRKLTGHFGAEILDIDLSEPMSDATFAAVSTAFDENSLILFRGQSLTPAQHIAFSSRWGELEHHVLQEYTLPDHPELFVLTNKKKDGKPLGAHKTGWHWHIDNTYMPRPSLGSQLYAREVPPEGGDTWFTSLTAAYDSLPEDLKARIADLKAVHSYAHVYALKYPDREPLSEERKAQVPDLVHPVVRTHPATGRKVLYISEYIIKQFIGMSVEESRELLDELNARATTDDLIYRHQWQVGDLICWDNRATMHFAQPYDDVNYTRLMHTTRVITDVFKGERAA